MFCSLWESESRVQNVESPIWHLSLRHRCGHTEEHTSWPHSQHCCRFSADLPSICHALLRPSHEASSLEAYKGTECLFSDPWWNSCEGWTLEMNFNYNFLQQAHLFCLFSEGSSLRLAQLLYHLVKQAVSILQQNKWFITFFQSPWIQNLLISRNKPISAQGFSVTYYNSDSISKRGSTRRIERICLDGRTGWCLNGLIILFD